MQHFQDVVLDRAGNAIAGAIITVTDHVLGTPALLYSDYAGLIAQTTTVTDANGSYSFYTNVTRCDFAMYRNGKLLKTVNDVFTDTDIGPIGLTGATGATGATGLIGAPGILNGLVYNPDTITSTMTVPSNYNALSIGPMTIAPNVDLTFSANSKWVIV